MARPTGMERYAAGLAPGIVGAGGVVQQGQANLRADELRLNEQRRQERMIQEGQAYQTGEREAGQEFRAEFDANTHARGEFEALLKSGAMPSAEAQALVDEQSRAGKLPPGVDPRVAGLAADAAFKTRVKAEDLATQRVRAKLNLDTRRMQIEAVKGVPSPEEDIEGVRATRLARQALAMTPLGETPQIDLKTGKYNPMPRVFGGGGYSGDLQGNMRRDYLKMIGQADARMKAGMDAIAKKRAMDTYRGSSAQADLSRQEQALREETHASYQKAYEFSRRNSLGLEPAEPGPPPPPPPPPPAQPQGGWFNPNRGAAPPGGTLTAPAPPPKAVPSRLADAVGGGRRLQRGQQVSGAGNIIQRAKSHPQSAKILARMKTIRAASPGTNGVAATEQAYREIVGD